MRFFFTPESHEFVRVWVPVAAIFVLYNIGKYYRKVFSAVVVLLVLISSYYYYDEIVGELNWNLIFSITFAMIFSCSLTVYLLSQYERKTDEIKDLAISIELKNEILSRSTKLSKSGYFQYRIDGRASYYSKEIKELYETENIEDHLKADKELFPDDRNRSDEQVIEAFKDEKPFYLYTRSLIKGETRRFVSRCKIFKENGVVVGFEGTTSDVSDIYNAKDELEIFRKVVENIPIKVYLVTKKGIIKFANQAVVNATGFSKEELINQPASKLSMRSDFDEVLKKMEAAGKGVPVFKEVTGKSKDGSLTKSELCVCLIDYQGEEVILGVTRDITAFETLRKSKFDREVAEKRLEEKNNFLSIVSHELRTPMNGIIGMIGVLEPELFDNEKREIFDIIKSSSSRLMEVLNDMLSIAKLESGSLKVVNSKFELEPTIKRVTELLSSNAKRKNNELIFNIPDRLYLNSDRLKIEQILINLISNAVKFTDGGKITINSFTEGSDLMIDVNDNGTGIPQDKQEYIFEMFTQADESLSRNFEGLGLGLAITKRLVDLLGATIELESAEGLGTTFTLKFPGVISEPENESSLHEPIEVPLKSEKPIAIIEDNLNNRRILVLMLKQLGYKSVEFVNGEDFLAHQNYEDFSYILLDIMLPKLSGEEVYKQLTSEGKVLPKTIAMTAHVLERDKEEILALGFEGFLGKPFRLEDLKEILN